MLFGLVKKLARLVVLVGVALLIAGSVSYFILDDFSENSVQVTARITSIDEGGFLSNGYDVNVRYEAAGAFHNATISSAEMGEEFRLLESRAAAAGLSVIAYVEKNPNLSTQIYYNSKLPDSAKSTLYEDPTKSFFIWGGIVLGAGLIIAIINSSMKKKHDEKKAEKRVKAKMEKQSGGR